MKTIRDLINALNNFAKATSAYVECQCMVAANQYREMQGHTIAYGEEDFWQVKQHLDDTLER